MDKVLFILIGSLVMGAFILFAEWFSGWMHSKTEEEQRLDGSLTRTRAPHRTKIGFRIVAFLVAFFSVGGGILMAVLGGEAPIGAWIAWLLAAMFFEALALLPLCSFMEEYEEIRDEGGFVKHPLGSKFNLFEEMVLYERGKLGDLTVLDEKGKPLFVVPSSRVGIGGLVVRLEAAGVKRK